MTKILMSSEEYLAGLFILAGRRSCWYTIVLVGQHFC